MRKTNIPAYLRLVTDTEDEKDAKRRSPPVVEPQRLRRDGPETVVLVVDDEPAIVTSLVIALTRAGYKALGAQSGERALSIVRSEAIDVLLIDLTIPDMRGDVIFEVAAGYQPHLRSCTLFMTGDVTERAYKLIAACKCHFLRKPFDLRDMTDAVAALLV